MDTIDLKRVDEILGGFEKKNSSLIPVLQAVEEEFGWVNKDAADLVAGRLNIYPSKVYGVLTFYAQFHLKPRGKHLVRLCCGTACHVKGGEQINEKMQEVLNIQSGGTTDDNNISYQTVACLGCCGLAPVVMINENFIKLIPQEVTMENIEKAINRGRKK